MEETKLKPILHASYCNGKDPALIVCDTHLNDLNDNDDFNRAVAEIVQRSMGIAADADFKMHLADKDHVRVTVLNKDGKAQDPEIKLAKDGKGIWSDEGGTLKLDAKAITESVTLIYDKVVRQANGCKSHTTSDKKKQKTSKTYDTPQPLNENSSSSSSSNSEESDSETEEESSESTIKEMATTNPTNLPKNKGEHPNSVKPMKTAPNTPCDSEDEDEEEQTAPIASPTTPEPLTEAPPGPGQSSVTEEESSEPIIEMATTNPTNLPKNKEEQPNSDKPMKTAPNTPCDSEDEDEEEQTAPIASPTTPKLPTEAPAGPGQSSVTDSVLKAVNSSPMDKSFLGNKIPKPSNGVAKGHSN